ncbi:MAG: TetR/AcrR family transcriptional regulator [Kofleriaceae bacterium]
MPRDVRTRIIAAAIKLVAKGGRDAVTTRAVAEAAGVQPPALYRLFGDKSTLLDAVADHGFAAYLKTKLVRKPGPDPVEDLRTGWDAHVEFGLANPVIHALMYGEPRPGVRSPAAAAAFAILDEHIRRVAAAGRLRVREDRAANLMHAAGSGVVMTLLAMPEDRRDLELSASAREAVIAAITTHTKPIKQPGPAAAAIALRAVLPTSTTLLTPAELVLLREWLDRLAG